MARSSFTNRVGCLTGALGMLLMMSAPMASFAGERAPVASPSGESRYSGRPIEADCHQYCLPPGYTLEQPRVPDAGPVQGEWVHESPAPVRQDDGYRQSTSGGDAYSYQRREEGYGWQASHEESYGYEDGYAYQDQYDDAEEGYDDRQAPPCQPRYDNRGRVLQSCGEIQLSDGFFYGATGGVGPDYIDAGGGGGGGGIAYASSGSSSGASAFASARASVGVSIRIGGGRGGHPGKPGGGGGGGHPGKGGCGCGH